MPLKRVDYKDAEGKYKAVLLPESEPDGYAEIRGIPIGPPDLSELGLPKETEVKLNNELYHRGIIDAHNAIKNKAEIAYALQAALKVDVERIVGIYLGRNTTNGSEAPEKFSDQTISDRGPRQSRQRAQLSGSR